MSANYVLLEKVTVGASGASSVTFNNIPQTGYTDLVVKVSSRSTDASAWDWLSLSLNGSTSNFTWRSLWADTSPASGSGSGVTIPYGGTAANATANTFSNTEIYIPNYTSSNYKSVSADAVGENNSATAGRSLTAILWSNTAAITSLSVNSSTTFVQYSTFSLYGIAAVGTTPTVAPYAAGGDIIQTDGTYWYHAFLSSGTFTPAKSLSCDVLVVAGGGGGGADDGGGGAGAGGLRLLTSNSLANSNPYTITVGAGGVGNNSSAPTQGTNGSNTSVTGSGFSTITVTGGGRGGAYTTGSRDGYSGGSGGGGGNNGGNGGAGNAGSYSPVEGYAGGAGYGTVSGSRAGGGGGGAGGTGTTPTSATGGAGGAGANSYNSNSFSGWLSTTGVGVSGLLAAGGTGGSSSTSNGTAGAANSGNGGNGGGANGNLGGAGGSGITIIRYLA